MSEERVSYESTEGGSILLPLNEMEECVACAAGLQPTFIISMGGVRRLETGENTTATWSACAEDATHMDMKNECCYCGKPSIHGGSGVCEEHGGYPVED